MRKLLAALLLLCAIPAAFAQDAPKLFDDIAATVRELSEITGLRATRSVPHASMSREDLRKYIQNKIKEEVKPEEIRTEELMLKKFGFLPRDFNLESATVELLTEQAAAFYDYHKRRLYILDSNADVMQQTALVHELAHALADQHFKLAKFIRTAESGDDSAMARMAVMEGQASWLTFEILSRKMGRSLKDSPAFLKNMAETMNSSTGQFPVLDKAPLYMRETLMFPYTQGMLFQQGLVEKWDKAAFTEIFRRPPVSTQQILHPALYFTHVMPSRPKAPPLPDAHKYRKSFEGSLGELDHAMLLRQYAGKPAEALAEKWKGCAFQIVEEKRGNRAMLAYVSEWQSPEAAREFFAHYRSILKGKWKRFEIGSETPSKLTGVGDDGRFVVELDGARVTSLEGLPNEKP